MEDLRERIVRLLKERGVLHIRQLIRELNTGYTQVKEALDGMVEEGVVEKFSHGGYTFYKLSENLGKDNEKGEGGPPTS